MRSLCNFLTYLFGYWTKSETFLDTFKAIGNLFTISLFDFLFIASGILNSSILPLSVRCLPRLTLYLLHHICLYYKRNKLILNRVKKTVPKMTTKEEDRFRALLLWNLYRSTYSNSTLSIWENRLYCRLLSQFYHQLNHDTMILEKEQYLGEVLFLRI